MAYLPMELAEAFLRSGELDDALAALTDQLTQQPADTYARRLRAQVLARLDQPAAALADLAALETLTPDDIGLQVRLHNALGNADIARQHLENALQQAYPNNLQLVELLYHQYLRLGHTSEAAALAQQQDGWRWQALCGDAQYAEGDYARAVQAYEAAQTALEARYPLPQDRLVGQWAAHLSLSVARCWVRLECWNTAEALLIPVIQVLHDPSADFLLAYSQYQRTSSPHAQAAMRDAWERCTPLVRDQIQVGLTLDERWWA